ncbi:hypothetical protein [Bacillus sp. KH172YL63]|uniref:hypothetical protein n=1 Tax=Bacillus sp. KH172YL63 TaxID=2709784 RepID=UPI0013E4D223|nr:hypothetical protein [Bacillus sp. KH172YL63]BCB05228.1 hypothetical protein KH172YL63_33610 [Bacillus sp. KH172YL63]
MRKIGIILGVIVLVVLLANVRTLVAYAKLYSFEQAKIVTIETKELTFEELFGTLHEQRNLAEQLEDSFVYSLIGDEIRRGADEASKHVIFLREHEKITAIKLELPVTTYEDGKQNVTFISGQGEVIEVLEEGEWKAFDGEVR